MAPKTAQNSTKSSGKRKRPDALKAFEFKPGQSGNPGGRPKKAILTDALRSHLEASPETLTKVIEALVEKLKAGDVKAFQAAADRLEGRPVQQVQVDGQMQVQVVVDL